MNYPWLGINYGNSLLGYTPSQRPTAIIAADLHTIRSITTRVRIAMADWNFLTPWITQMQQVAVMAKAAGLKVSWGLTSTNTPLTASNWPAFQTAVVAAARWAAANGIDEFLVCNEMDKKHDGSLTDAQQRANIRGLANAVKSAGYGGAVAVAISQDAITPWYSEGFGVFDTIGLNLYYPYDAQFTTTLTTFLSHVGTKGFLSEWNVVNDWAQVQTLPDERLAQLIANRLQLISASGISRAYYFTYDHINYNNLAGSDDVWAAHLHTGNFRRLWQILGGVRRGAE